MKVSVVSFSYPRGLPDDPDDDYRGGFVFDCRSLPDPHGIEVEVKHTACEFWNA